MKKAFLSFLFIASALSLVLMGCDSERSLGYVRLNANGGVLNGATYTKTNKNGKVDEPSVSRPYSTLVGWFESPDFSGNAWDFGKDVADPDSRVILQLYAKWDPQFLLEGGSIGKNKGSLYSLPKDLVIPSSLDGEDVTRIAYEGFKGDLSIETVKIPSSIESIGSGCFEGCSNLSRIEFEGSFDKWDSIAKNADWNKGIKNGAKLVCKEGKEVILNP